MHKSAFTRWLLACAALLSASAFAEAPSSSVATRPEPSVANEVASPLLAIDRNRGTVTDRIVNQWGPALEAANAGITAAQLREMLLGMRADQLLAASLAGSLDGLRNVVSAALVSDSEVKPSLLQSKALGEADKDLVYVPVTPCRLVDTRAPFLAVYQNGGPFAPSEARNYTLQGGNGVCLTQLPPTVSPSAVQMQVYGIPTTAGSGDIEILPQGGTFGGTAVMVYGGSTNGFTSTAATSLANLGNKQISVQVRGPGANIAIDVVGYFRAPAGGYVSSITAGAGLTGGTITSTGTIAVDTAAIQSRVTGTCGAGSSIRTIKSDGTVVCQPDTVGTGTVTSVATGTGLTGGPITSSGTVSIAAGGVSASELASDAVITAKIADANVTKSKLGATGGASGQVLSTDGTALVWRSVPAIVSFAGPAGSSIAGSPVYVFVGPTASITIPAGPIQRLTGSAVALLGLSAGAAAQDFDFGICYQAGGVGDVTNFFGNYTTGRATTVRTAYPAAASVSVGPGTYSVGFCVRNGGPNALTSNDYVNGWVMLTPL
ncbi:MAG: hypothetical protein U1F54_19040 [Burkholderiales bacterium]